MNSEAASPRRPEVPTPSSHAQGAKAALPPAEANESPMDFVTKALGAPPQDNFNPQDVADAAAAARIKPAGPQPTPGVPSDTGLVTLDRILNSGKVVENKAPPSPPKPQETPSEPKSLFDKPNEEAPTEEPEEEVPAPEVQEGETPEESFKKLRSLVGETKSKLKALEKEKDELEKKVLGYETGAVVPEVLKELKQRVDELEPLEKIHRLKTSKVYNDKLVKPIKRLETRLVEKGKEYDIPEEVIKEVISLKGAERNAFLSDHFDTAGIIDAKAILEPLDKLNSELKEAENEPTKALAHLETKTSAEMESAKAERKEKFSAKAKSTWTNTLLKLRKEGKAEMLIPRDGDDEHNKKFVFPLQAKAASDYGQFVSAFEELGMEELPDEIASPLANMVVLAHSAATANEALRILNEKYEALLNGTKRINPLLRPSIGGGASGGNGAPAAKGPSSPLEAGEALINSVLQSRGG